LRLADVRAELAAPAAEREVKKKAVEVAEAGYRLGRAGHSEVGQARVESARAGEHYKAAQEKVKTLTEAAARLEGQLAGPQRPAPPVEGGTHAEGALSRRRRRWDWSPAAWRCDGRWGGRDGRWPLRWKESGTFARSVRLSAEVGSRSKRLGCRRLAIARA
jgi:hypothetical protein